MTRHQLNNLNVQFQQAIAASELPIEFQERLTSSIGSAFRSEFEVIMQIESELPEDWEEKRRREAYEADLQQMQAAFDSRRITINHIPFK